MKEVVIHCNVFTINHLMKEVEEKAYELAKKHTNVQAFRYKTKQLIDTILVYPFKDGVVQLSKELLRMNIINGKARITSHTHSIHIQIPCNEPCAKVCTKLLKQFEAVFEVIV